MKTLQHKFVEVIPEVLKDGTLYITIKYRTAVHKCVCGCGNKVVTPISPNSWRLTFDGKTISLYPSIGNWNFDCRSHYWIVNNTIRHAEKINVEEIKQNKTSDKKQKKHIFFRWKKE